MDDIQTVRDAIRVAFADIPRPDLARLLDARRWPGEAKALRDFRRGSWAHFGRTSRPT